MEKSDARHICIFLVDLVERLKRDWDAGFRQVGIWQWTTYRYPEVHIHFGSVSGAAIDRRDCGADTVARLGFMNRQGLYI